MIGTLRKIIESILVQTEYHQQEQLMTELFELLGSVANVQGSAVQREFGETGLLISSHNAATCLTGTARTLCYWKSLLIAVEKLPVKGEEPLRILYPGCGPFATLVLPLLAGLVSRNLEIHVIEINDQSAASLNVFFKHLQTPCVSCQIHHCDVLDFQSSMPFDLMISEVMLASLQEEGQVAITYHLTQFLAPHGILIPELIKVDLCWSDVTKEFAFVNQYRQKGEGVSQEQLSQFRQPLSPLIQLGKDVRERYKTNGEYLLLGCAEFKHGWPKNGAVICTTNIHFIDEIKLDEYQNGLTSPIAMTESGCVPGVPLKIMFKMLKKPGYEFVTA